MPHYLIKASGETGITGAPQLREYLIEAPDKIEAKEAVINIMGRDEGFDVLKILSIREEVKS